MQTRVRLESIAGLAQMPKGTVPNQPDRPQFYAHLVTFSQVTPDATGNPVGNVHLAGFNGPLQLILEGGKDEDIAVGSDYILTLERADKGGQK